MRRSGSFFEIGCPRLTPSYLDPQDAATPGGLDARWRAGSRVLESPLFSGYVTRPKLDVVFAQETIGDHRGMEHVTRTLPAPTVQSQVAQRLLDDVLNDGSCSFALLVAPVSDLKGRTP